MKRILVLSVSDWLAPERGNFELYLREVLTRIAAAGHYVALVTHDPWFMPWRSGRRPKLEVHEGVQIGRLGPRLFHRLMTSILIARLARQGRLARQFDVIIDCVCDTGRPTEEITTPPTIPLVYRSGTDVSSLTRQSGPVVAVTRDAREILIKAGVAPSRIIQASFASSPPGVSLAPTLVPNTALTLAVSSSAMAFVQKAVRRTELSDLEIRCVPIPRKTSEETVHAAVLGPGEEWMLPGLAAQGIPTVCPDSSLGRELVADGVTGLLYPPGKAKVLAERIEKICRDELLRRRVSEAGLSPGQWSSWERTAGLVLAAVEILSEAD